MNAKYVGFDIDSKKTVACVLERGQKDRYATPKTDPVEMQSSFCGRNAKTPGGSA